MLTAEYNEFVYKLIEATSDFFKDVSYHTYTCKPTKIKLKMYGKSWNEIEFSNFRDICRDLSVEYKSQFEKFNISPTPQIYFCAQRETVTVKWFVNIDQWLPSQ